MQAFDNLFAIQISDTHFSASLQTPVLNRSPNLRGHDPSLCRLLQTRIRKLRIDGLPVINPFWIHSGDLTRTGLTEEFHTAEEFIKADPGRRSNGRAERPTLEVPADRSVNVPGNHDHWAGWDSDSIKDWAWKNPPPAFNADLHQEPGVSQTVWNTSGNPWRSEKGTIEFHLFGIDSNSGLVDQTANRLARGEISDAEFAELEDQLAESHAADLRAGVTVVRAIICHHAFTKAEGLTEARPLEETHVEKLLSLSAEYGVAAVLTGHTHYVNFQKHNRKTVPFGTQKEAERSVFEIRSPTTLQGKSNALQHGFWVHQLLRDAPDSPVIWRPRLYLVAGRRLKPQGVKHLENIYVP